MFGGALTSGRIDVLGLELCGEKNQVSRLFFILIPRVGLQFHCTRETHLAGNGALVGGLALDGEGDTVGGLGLDLKVG